MRDFGVASYSSPPSAGDLSLLGPSPSPATGDRLLDRMGGGFEGWNARTLLQYFYGRYEGAFGVRYPEQTNGVVEYIVMRDFVERWHGVQVAGPMVKALFDLHGGRWEGNPFVIGWFSKRWNYVHQILHTESQGPQPAGILDGMTNAASLFGV